MHRRIRRRKIKKYFRVGIIIILIFALVWFFIKREKHEFVRSDKVEQIVVNDDGFERIIKDVDAKTVGDVLKNAGIELKEKDRIFPSKDSQVFADDIITITRNKTLTVKVDNEEKKFDTYGERIGEILARNNVKLDDNDIVVPVASTVVKNDLTTEVTRVEFKEEAVTKKIPFKKIVEEDGDMSFLKSKLKQKGEFGKKKIIYKVAYHDGKEVDKNIDREEIIKEPVDEITVKGTKVKLGKKHTGACSWYSHTGTLSAANPWLPKGSYVKVTNKANGKSVIVQINDRGPFVPGRIIDLDKVAFTKIASLGAGVIDVKMEEIIP